MPKRLLIATVSAMLFAGCHSRSAVPERAASLAFDAVKLSRTACYGKCPVYDVEIKSDGTVIYDGKAFVKSLGRQQAAISKDSLSLLSLGVRHVQLPAMRARYVDEQDGCKSTVTDFPGMSIAVTQAGTTRSVHFYTGCLGAGAPTNRLAWLGETIDLLAGTDKWVGEAPH